MVEKILARASGNASVRAGDIIVADVDVAIMHEMSCWSSSRVFVNEVHGTEIKDPAQKVVIFDHVFSPPNESTATMLAWDRAFCREHGITLYDCGNGNLHHVAMRNGHVRPGSLVVGSDSHSPVHGVAGAFSCALGNDVFASMVLPQSKAWLRVPYPVRVRLTGQPVRGAGPRDVALWLVGQIGEGGANYASLELCGDYLEGLSFWDRWLFPLLAVDIGAKCVYLQPDDVMLDYVRTVVPGEYRLAYTDSGVTFAEEWTFDVSVVEPQVAVPPSVGNVRPVTEVVGIPIDYADLGGHAGGRLEDIAAVADTLDELDADPVVPFNIVPSSRKVFSEALELGIVKRLHDRGATWFPPSTGANQSFNMGALAPGQTMVTTQSRNFPGRNGSPDGKMYLASARTVAMAAAAGEIVDTASRS